jgi:RIO kinase 1
MPNRFCAICGKQIDDTAPHFGMCLSCYLNEHPLFELPNDVSFKVCIDCGSYSKKEEWFSPAENELYSIIDEAIFKFHLKSYLKQGNIEFNLFIDESSFKFTSKELVKSATITVLGTLKEDKNIEHQQTIKLSLLHELCNNCLNLRGGTFYLSIIQLRVKDEAQFKFLKKIIDDVHNYAEKQFQKDPKHYLSKMEDQKNGVDLYLSSKEIMNHIISYLKGKYHFILKRSKKLVGRDTQRGKNLYRLKSLIKFLPINKKDVVIIDNEEFYIESITKNRIILKKENGTKLIKDYSYFFNEKFSIKTMQEDNKLEDTTNEKGEDLEEYLDSDLDDKINSSLDELEKKSIDEKKIKKIDQTKKRAAVDSVFDERTTFQLNRLLVNGPLDRIEGIISAGKEANVYLAYDRDEREIAIKIYKIDSNTSRWMHNYIVGDPRFKKIPHNISKIIFLWASKEFKNLKRAHKAGLRVPEPLLIKNNILLMEYIGFGPIPAPKLKDIKNPKEIENLAEEILEFIKQLYQNAKLVHGDLSEFNILYHNQQPVVIDISQAVTIEHPKAIIYLERDIKNIFNYFEKLGVKMPDPYKYYYEILQIDQN